MTIKQVAWIDALYEESTNIVIINSDRARDASGISINRVTVDTPESSYVVIYAVAVTNDVVEGEDHLTITMPGEGRVPFDVPKHSVFVNGTYSKITEAMEEVEGIWHKIKAHIPRVMEEMVATCTSKNHFLAMPPMGSDVTSTIARKAFMKSMLCYTYGIYHISNHHVLLGVNGDSLPKEIEDAFDSIGNYRVPMLNSSLNVDVKVGMVKASSLHFDSRYVTIYPGRGKQIKIPHLLMINVLGPAMGFINPVNRDNLKDLVNAWTLSTDTIELIDVEE